MDRGTSWRWQKAAECAGVHRQEHSKTSNGLTLINCSRLNFLACTVVYRINKKKNTLLVTRPPRYSESISMQSLNARI